MVIHSVRPFSALLPAHGSIATGIRTRTGVFENAGAGTSAQRLGLRDSAGATLPSAEALDGHSVFWPGGFGGAHSRTLPVGKVVCLMGRGVGRVGVVGAGSVGAGLFQRMFRRKCGGSEVTK